MIHKLKRRFILYATAIITVIVALTLLFALHRNSSEYYLWRYLAFGIILIVSVLIGSILISSLAVKPIQKAWQQQLDFTADASHELRTPLSVIQSNLEIVLESKDSTIAEQEKWLNNIERESHRMTALVESLLTLSRADTGTNLPILEELPLSAFLNVKKEAFSALAASKAVEILLQVPEDLVVLADRGKMDQLFTILFDNALKYMGRPGTIQITSSLQKKYIQIDFRDNGTGIATEDLPHIFERFYRADKSRGGSTKGTGLGLAIAQMIVKEHSGSIQAESSPGVGTVFHIHLPV